MNKITILSKDEFPGWHGLSKRIEGEVALLKKQGKLPTILAPKSAGRSGESEDAEYLNSDLLKALQRIGLGFVSTVMFLAWSTMRLAINSGSLQVVQHEHMLSALPAMIVRELSRGRIKVVADDINLVFPRHHGVRRKLISLYELGLLRKADVIITGSEITKDVIWKKLKREVVWVPNGTAVQSSGDADRDPRNMIFVGTFNLSNNVKGIIHILRAAQYLHEKGLNFRISIVGGPVTKVKSLLEHPLVRLQKVVFTGNLTDAELDSIYRQVYIGLLPFFAAEFRWGGNVTKLAEYLSHGLLIVSGPEGVRSAPDMNQDENFVLVRDIDEMERILEKVISDRQGYETIRRNGQNLAIQYSWDRIGQPYLQAMARMERLSGASTSGFRTESI